MIDQSKVRMFITQGLGPVIGEDALGDLTLEYIKLRHPLRIVPQNGDSVGISPLFLKEEWCIIPLASSVEISVEDGICQLYSDYEIKIFSGIVIANSQNTAGLKLV